MKKGISTILFCIFVFSLLGSLQAEDTFVVLALKHQNIEAAQDLLFNEISNKEHAKYGKYLTQHQLGQLFGASEESRKYIKEWMSEFEVKEVRTSPSLDWLSFYVTAEDAKLLAKEEKLFEAKKSPLNEHLDLIRVFERGEPSLATKTSAEKSWLEFSLPTQHVEPLHQSSEKLIPHVSTFRTSANSIHFVIIPQYVNKQQIQLYNHDKAVTEVTIATSLANGATRSELQFKVNSNDNDDDFKCLACSSLAASSLLEAVRVRELCSSLHPNQLICFSRELKASELLPFPSFYNNNNNNNNNNKKVLLRFAVKLSFFDHFETPFVTLDNQLEAQSSSSSSDSISVLFSDDGMDKMDPNTQRLIYGVNPSTVGTNSKNKQMVWGTGSYGISLSDMESFYSQFDVQSSTSYVRSLGQAGDSTGSNWVEATLDAQYISAIAPQVLTTCLNTDNNTNAEASTGFGDALLYFALAMSLDPSPPLVVSMSLGSLSYDSCNLLCTQAANMGVATYDYCTSFVQHQYQTCMYSSANLVSRINTEFMLMGLRGITLLGAAGDGGNHFSFGAFIAIGENATLAKTLNQISCNYSMPTFPAASPYVTAVGGLQINSSSSGEYIPVGCSSQTGGDITGGCGFSWEFPMPAYQKSFVQNYLNSLPAGTPLGLFNSSGRAYPDISGIASMVPIVCNDVTSLVYGTSCSTPEVAGLISLINDHRLNNNLPPLGFLNTRLYQSAASFASSMFVDATQGISSCGTNICCDNGFPAAPGWDSFTGFGNPSFPGLLQVFGSD